MTGNLRYNKAVELKSKSEFYYSTIDLIRNRIGISSSDLPDSTALFYIRLASKYINLVTKQWFQPKRIIQGFGGRNRCELDLTGFTPLLELNAVEIFDDRSLRSGGFHNGIREDEVSISRCGSFLISNRGRFPAGASNVMVDGWWGYLENHKHLEFLVASGSSLVSGTSSIYLNAVSGTSTISFGNESFNAITLSENFDNRLRERDVLVFIDSTKREIESRIINSINYSTGQITFDPLQKEPHISVGSGSRVVCFGAVPEEIEFACNKIIQDTYDSSERDSKGLKSEKTDNYQYNRFSPFEAGQPGLEEISSSPFVNNILANYYNDGYVSI